MFYLLEAMALSNILKVLVIKTMNNNCYGSINSNRYMRGNIE